ncbi:hypothetical protein GCM10007908_22400 [Rhizobium albus]|nr:hypothetical protein GCM10007908_22400 [Rhizobium albus]
MIGKPVVVDGLTLVALARAAEAVTEAMGYPVTHYSEQLVLMVDEYGYESLKPDRFMRRSITDHAGAKGVRRLRRMICRPQIAKIVE